MSTAPTVKMNRKKLIPILGALALLTFIIWAFAFQNCAVCNSIAANLFGNDSNGDNNGDSEGLYQRTDISVATAYSMIYEPETPEALLDLFILDVRTQSEYDAGHINNSILMPYDTISQNLVTLLPYQNSTLIVYCRSGSRSLIASNELVSYNFTGIQNMLGGYSTWVDAGYPVMI